jgi:hypothetical protein
MRRLLAELADPARYRRVLERMRAEKPRRRLDEPGPDGVPLAALVLTARRFARLVAAAIRRGEYRPAPAEVRRVLLDKERDLHRFRAADLVVHKVVAELLAEAAEPLSPCLYSYRPGRSSFAAVRALAAYLRAHRRAHADPRRRGLHVHHCDVRSYGESIPLGASAPLWDDLRSLCGDAGELVTALVRPEIVSRDGGLATPLVGLATGSPIATVIANLYLAPLDRELDGVPAAFYARYGDDLLFAHPDGAEVDRAEARIVSMLEARGLALNPQKRLRVYFTGAGRADGATRGATWVAFLGCRVAFDGTVGLPPAKLRALLADLRARVARSAALAARVAPGERARLVCAALARALDGRDPAATRYASWLRSVVTDRPQLAAIDHELARAAATALTGRTGVRAFRDLPPRALHALGLPSLVRQRNAP